MKHREFIYVGVPVPDLDGQEYAAFLLNIQKGILFSLEKRKLLTSLQRERCLAELENQYSQKERNKRSYSYLYIEATAPEADGKGALE